MTKTPIPFGGSSHLKSVLTDILMVIPQRQLPFNHLNDDVESGSFLNFEQSRITLTIECLSLSEIPILVLFEGKFRASGSEANSKVAA